MGRPRHRIASEVLTTVYVCVCVNKESIQGRTDKQLSSRSVCQRAAEVSAELGAETVARGAGRGRGLQVRDTSRDQVPSPRSQRETEATHGFRPQLHSPSARIGAPGICLWVCPLGSPSTWSPPSLVLPHSHRAGRTQSRLRSRRAGGGRWRLSPLEPQLSVSEDGPCLPRGKQWHAGRCSDKCRGEHPAPRALMQRHKGLLSAPAASIPDSGVLMRKV